MLQRTRWCLALALALALVALAPAAAVGRSGQEGAVQRGEIERRGPTGVVQRGEIERRGPTGVVQRAAIERRGPTGVVQRAAIERRGPTGIVRPVAGAQRGHGVFLLAGPGAAAATGVLMLPDASVLVAAGSVRRLTPDGRAETVRGLGATGLALAPDGSVLAVDARPEQNVVRLWRPGGRVVVVAGRGGGPLQGFAGDGGPATSARLALHHHLPPASGILALPLGGFLFADGGNHRVRGVDATGVIRTVAGSGRLAGPGSARIGDGGPALAAGFGEPAGLAATAGGGYLVAERRGRRLRRVRPDGIVETVVGDLDDPRGVTVLADATTVFTDRGLPWAIPARARRPVPLFRRGPSDPDDFAGRLVVGDGVADDGRGGLLLAGAAGVFYAPRGPTPWALAALRRTRIGRRAVEAVVETTRPGVAALELTRRGRVLGRTTRPVGAGHTTLRAPAAVPSDWLRVSVSVRFRNGSTRGDAVVVHGARVLTGRLARRLLKTDARCRAFGSHRVDCEVRDGGGSCEWIASLSLAPTGVVLQRRYACGGFRRLPEWDEAFGATDQAPVVGRRARARGIAERAPWGELGPVP